MEFCAGCGFELTIVAIERKRMKGVWARRNKFVARSIQGKDLARLGPESRTLRWDQGRPPKRTRQITCATLQRKAVLCTVQSSSPSTVITSVHMSIQDRTNEFKSCVDSIRNRSALGNRAAEAKQRLIQSKATNKGEFSRMANSIGKEISSTTIKLNKLGQCTYFFLRHIGWPNHLLK